MNFKEIINKVSKGSLNIGYNDNKELIVDIENTNSIIITGETGTGKSIILDEILLELLNTYTSDELRLICIDTSGVELEYYNNTNHMLLGAFNDLKASEEILFKVLREIERRKELLTNNKVLTVSDYNKISDKKLPILVLAIDDDKSLLDNKDLSNMLTAIISQNSGLDIFVVMATSNVYNNFFERDNNTLARLLITFDYTSDDESKRINIEGSQNLNIGKFIAKSNNNEEIYHNYDFDNDYIKEFLDLN